MMKKIRYLLEALFAYSFFGFISLLPFAVSSRFCGYLAKKLGPLTSAHRVARENLRTVYPTLAEAEIKGILCLMWENLGRNIGEFPHISKLKDKQIKEHVDVTFKCKIPKNTGVFFVSAHYANWEMILRINKLHGIKMHSLQRSLNNPFVNNLVVKLRRASGAEGIIEKGVLGVKQCINILKSNGLVGALVDQKLNDGVPAKFLDLDAYTTNLPEKLYAKNLCQIIFIKINRVSGCNFEVTYYKKQLNKLNITQQINDEIGSWILNDPSQWFWVHNRWNLISRKKRVGSKK